MNVWLPLALLGAPLAAAFWVLLMRRRANAREAGSIVAALAMTLFAALIGDLVLRGEPVEVVIAPLVPGAALHLRADRLGALFAGMASGLWFLTTIYSIGYMRGLGEHAQTRYYFWFSICLLATGGLALSANLVTFFLFYELLTLATYPLVIHSGTEKAISAGRMYLAYTLGAGLMLLVGILWVGVAAGDLELRPGGVLPATMSRGDLSAIFALLVVGVAVKAAIMPLHSWLPAAMVAPTPVSALLHAVAVVKAGVFGVARVVGWVFGPERAADIGAAEVLAWAAAVTILVSSAIALLQDDLKRRLAFSTVGQLSYCVLGFALLTPSGHAGGAFHMLAHGLMKITLFFCVGAIYVTTHKTRVSQLDGIGRQMPVTMAAFAVGALGLAGFPPVAGFTSKWLLLKGTAEAGQLAFAVILSISSVLNIAYFMPIIVRAYLRPSPDHPRLLEARPALLVPLVVTAALSLLVGLDPEQPARVVAVIASAFRGAAP
jgi:multicomponent Na+:H+ antiporter subunit D